MMDRKRILDQLIVRFAQGNQSKFARMLNCQAGVVSGWLRRNTLDAERIKAAFPQVDGNWLLTGDGNMLLRQSPPSKQTNVHQSNVQVGGDNVIKNNENDANTENNSEIRLLRQQIESLQSLLAEKERVIRILLESRQG